MRSVQIRAKALSTRLNRLAAVVLSRTPRMGSSTTLVVLRCLQRASGKSQNAPIRLLSRRERLGPGRGHGPTALGSSFASICSRFGSRSSTLRILWFQHRCLPASGPHHPAVAQIAGWPSATSSRRASMPRALRSRNTAIHDSIHSQ